MAGFHIKTFKKDDNYYTPKYVWENIKNFIPKNKIIWEPFWGDGKSGKDLQDLGFNVIHKKEDFFKTNYGDIVITNPPYSKKKKVLQRLKDLNKPFILIMPCSTITTKYLRNLYKEIQIIIPPKRIHFIKNNNLTSRCNFDCFYFCYKINLPQDIIFL